MEDSKKTLVGLRRGIEIINILARFPQGYSFNQLQSKCDDLPAPTLSRLLKVLQDERLIEKNEVNYKIGSKLLEIARASLSCLPRKDIIRPVLEALADNTNQSAAYFEFDSDAIILISKMEKANSFHYIDPLERNTRMTRSGFAQVCLAYQSDHEVMRLVNSLEGQLSLAKEDFLKRLAKIREEKFFFESGEGMPGLQRFVSPVFIKDKFIGAIGITSLGGERAEEKNERYKHEVIWEAERATRLLNEHCEVLIE